MLSATIQVAEARPRHVPSGLPFALLTGARRLATRRPSCGAPLARSGSSGNGRSRSLSPERPRWGLRGQADKESPQSGLWGRSKWKEHDFDRGIGKGVGGDLAGSADTELTRSSRSVVRPKALPTERWPVPPWAGALPAVALMSQASSLRTLAAPHAGRESSTRLRADDCVGLRRPGRVLELAVSLEASCQLGMSALPDPEAFGVERDGWIAVDEEVPQREGSGGKQRERHGKDEHRLEHIARGRVRQDAEHTVCAQLLIDAAQTE